MRSLADLNRRTRFCRPLPNPSAKRPILKISKEPHPNSGGILGLVFDAPFFPLQQPRRLRKAFHPWPFCLRSADPLKFCKGNKIIPVSSKAGESYGDLYRSCCPLLAFPSGSQPFGSGISRQRSLESSDNQNIKLQLAEQNSYEWVIFN